MIKKLLIGTHNTAKIRFYKKYLSDLPYKIYTALDLNLPEPDENADTLEGNALLKAKYYYGLTNLPSIADDGGLVIPALNDFPGVKSKRFIENSTDERIILEILKKMNGLKGQERQASFKVVVALVLSKEDSYIETAEISGHIPEKSYEKIMKDFPYRSLLFVTALKKWFYEITEEDERAIGYRITALEKLKMHLS